MREVVCSYCGAVFFSRAEDLVCPHCGRNPRGRPWKALWASEKLWLILWIVWVFVLLRPSSRDDWVVDAALLALALPVTLSLAHFKKQGKVIALDLNRRGISENSLEPTPPPRPRVPEMWAGVVSSVQPRDVFWPTKSLLWMVVEGLWAAGTIGFAVQWMYRYGSSWPKWRRGWEHNLLFVAITGLVEAAMLFSLYREIRNAELLRDGEVSIGNVIDITEDRRALPFATYQYWTSTGERFQHVGLVVSDRDEWSAPGVVPVFYFPEDPTKSLALFSTRLRVRTTSDDFSRRAKRIGIGS